jgi:type I restriction enzyme R subunit
MSEFKQIIGRGTRVRDDYGKLWFSILDYTGSATRLFADPDFDGDPAQVTEEELKEYWEAQSVKEEPTPPVPNPEPQPPVIVDPPPPGERRKFYFDGGNVEIAAHLVYELDPDGKQLRVIRYTDYAGEKVRTLFPDVKELRKQWSDPAARTKIIESLAERGISFDELAEAAGQPEADPFDLICHLAHNAPLRTRRERAHALRTDRKDFFGQYSPEARQILEELLEKYAEHGTAQFVLPDVLDVPPISDHGQPGEIVRLFGGAKELREAVTQLQTLLYSA